MRAATESHLDLPEGLTAREALLLLHVLARVKAHGYGRLQVTISDGRIVGVEVVERLDVQRLAVPGSVR
jgi:hypothetical protein